MQSAAVAVLIATLLGIHSARAAQNAVGQPLVVVNAHVLLTCNITSWPWQQTPGSLEHHSCISFRAEATPVHEKIDDSAQAGMTEQQEVCTHAAHQAVDEPGSLQLLVRLPQYANGTVMPVMHHTLLVTATISQVPPHHAAAAAHIGFRAWVLPLSDHHVQMIWDGQHDPQVSWASAATAGTERAVGGDASGGLDNTEKHSAPVTPPESHTQEYISTGDALERCTAASEGCEGQGHQGPNQHTPALRVQMSGGYQAAMADTLAALSAQQLCFGWGGTDSHTDVMLEDTAVSPDTCLPLSTAVAAVAAVTCFATCVGLCVVQSMFSRRSVRKTPPVSHVTAVRGAAHPAPAPAAAQPSQQQQQGSGTPDWFKHKGGHEDIQGQQPAAAGGHRAGRASGMRQSLSTLAAGAARVLLGTPSKAAAGIPEQGEDEDGREEFGRGVGTGRWARDEDGRLRKLSGPGQAAAVRDDAPGMGNAE